MRRWLTLSCEGEWLGAALDKASGGTGVLMASGGTELACGAHGGMARVAAALAERGLPVLRFDRRGAGDSTGTDPGFDGSAPDIAAALAGLRRECPHVTRVIGVGNCDAACALLLAEADVDALVLTNIWLDRAGGSEATLPHAAAIRRRYLEKLTSPHEWWRLISGGVDLTKLMAGLHAARTSEPATDLTTALARATAALRRPATVLLAEHDATAIGFSDALSREPLRSAAASLTVRRYPSRSHSFAEETDRALLVDAVLAHATR